MFGKTTKITWFCAGFALIPAVLPAASASNVEDEVQLLREQNALLQAQVQKQGAELNALTAKVQKIEGTSDAQAIAAGENPPPPGTGYEFGNVHLSAEGGAAFFNSGRDGATPNSEFRVDEARVFIEAPVWDDVYFYSDVDLATRETTSLSSQLGELYLDFENVSKYFGKQDLLNVRVGRMDIPFGEEYINRYAMENPLISHSVSDLWGIDPGVELYGKLGKFSYVAAVQNGGGNGVRDFNGDKSVMGRVSYDPNETLHFSLSAMRTGDIDVQNDYTTALWFGNGWFHALDPANTTRFHVEGAEADVTAKWKTGHVSAFGGYFRYSDNDTMANNNRGIYYYELETVQNLPHKFYAAMRFSQVLVPRGYSLVGFGNMAQYFNSELTKSLWRWSIGGGYRFSDRLAVKAEYSFERGREVNGSLRNHEDFVSTEAVFKF